MTKQADSAQMNGYPVPDRYRSVLKYLDITFGTAFFGLMCLLTYQWLTNQTSGKGLFVVGLFLIGNLTISFFSVKVNDQNQRLKIEIFRYAVFNQILSPLCLAWVDGPLAPFWLPYLTLAVGVGPLLISLQRYRNRIGFSILAFELTTFVIAVFLTSSDPLITHLDDFLALGVSGLVFMLIFYSFTILSEREIEKSIQLKAETEHSRQTNKELRKKIVERREIEQELQESMLRFEQAVGNIDQVLWMTDVNKKEIIYISPVYERIWGRSCASLYFNPQSFIEGIHPEDRPKVVEAMAKQPLGTYDETYRVVHANGESRWVNDKAFPIRNLQGDIYRIVGVVTDITEKKFTEELLEQQRAHLANASKLSALGEMAGSIAHEINNPIAIIQAKAEQMKTQLAAGTPDLSRLSAGVERIVATSERISKIVRSLLMVSRESNENKFDEILLTDLIEDVENLCRERFRHAGIQFVIQDYSKDLRLECSLVQIAQVLTNLLNNSYDAVEVLEEKWIRLSVEDLDAMISLSVTDSGNGIAPHLQSKIMNPFFTTKEIGKGTGLGLSISKSIVSAHQGDFFLDQKARNTTFVLLLPKKQTKAKIVA